MRLPAGAPVLCTAPAGLPMYGRLVPGDYARGLLLLRLTVDHPRARKGACVYVLAKYARTYRRGRHASGVRKRSVQWLYTWRHRR